MDPLNQLRQQNRRENVKQIPPESKSGSSAAAPLILEKCSEQVDPLRRSKFRSEAKRTSVANESWTTADFAPLPSRNVANNTASQQTSSNSSPKTGALKDLLKPAQTALSVLDSLPSRQPNILTGGGKVHTAPSVWSSHEDIHPTDSGQAESFLPLVTVSSHLLGSDHMQQMWQQPEQQQRQQRQQRQQQRQNRELAAEDIEERLSRTQKDTARKSDVTKEKPLYSLGWSGQSHGSQNPLHLKHEFSSEASQLSGKERSEWFERASVDRPSQAYGTSSLGPSFQTKRPVKLETAETRSTHVEKQSRGLSALTHNIVGHARDLHAFARNAASTFLGSAAHNARALEDFDMNQLYGVLFDKNSGSQTDVGNEDAVLSSGGNLERNSWRLDMVTQMLYKEDIGQPNPSRHTKLYHSRLPFHGNVQSGWSRSIPSKSRFIRHCVSCGSTYAVALTNRNFYVPLNLMALYQRSGLAAISAASAGVSSAASAGVSSAVSAGVSSVAPTGVPSAGEVSQEPLILDKLALLLLESPNVAVPCKLRCDGKLVWIDIDIQHLLKIRRAADVAIGLLPLILTNALVAPVYLVDDMTRVPPSSKCRAMIKSALIAETHHSAARTQTRRVTSGRMKSASVESTQQNPTTEFLSGPTLDSVDSSSSYPARQEQSQIKGQVKDGATHATQGCSVIGAPEAPLHLAPANVTTTSTGSSTETLPSSSPNLRESRESAPVTYLPRSSRHLPASGIQTNQLMRADASLLEISFKDLRRKVRLFFSSLSALNQVQSLLASACFPQDIRRTLAFQRVSGGSANPARNAGLYDPEKEWGRLLRRPAGITLRISSANTTFGLCPTYPKLAVVPKAISDLDLVKIAEFRAKGRYPILSWISRVHSAATLWRCSQPKAMFNRCAEDENYFTAIRSVPNIGDIGQHRNRLLILDARSYVSAVANKAAGAGFESTSSNYSGCRIEFANIQNIHQVRDACRLQALAVQACQLVPSLTLSGALMAPHASKAIMKASSESISCPENSCAICDKPFAWNSEAAAGEAAACSRYTGPVSEESEGLSIALDATSPLLFDTTGFNNPLAFNSNLAFSQLTPQIAKAGWYDQIQCVLRASNLVAGRLRSGEPVVVHCSDGWDRTAQITSLAMLSLDCYYRTLKGFFLLIEQEFIHAGHQFRSRCGHPGDMSRLDLDKSRRSLPPYEVEDGDVTLDNSTAEGNLEEMKLSPPLHGVAALATVAPVVMNRTGGPSRGRRSPVFLQWLDCVWQLMNQFPEQFEFSPVVLLILAHEVYASSYGTFFFDCVQEREVANAQSNTACLWTDLLNRKGFFVAQKYQPCHEQAANPDTIESSQQDPSEVPCQLLLPDPQHVTIWADYWFQ